MAWVLLTLVPLTGVFVAFQPQWWAYSVSGLSIQLL